MSARSEQSKKAKVGGLDQMPTSAFSSARNRHAQENAVVLAPRLTLSQPHQSNHPPSSPQGKCTKAKNKTVKVKRASKTRRPDLLFAKG